jgi:hypothetical protein
MNFLYLKIPVVNQVPDKTRQMEDKVDQILQQAGIGAVAGWGDSLGAALPDGSRPVAYTRIDVDVLNLASARVLLRTELPAVGAPDGTEIHYAIGNRNFKDIYLDAAWRLDQPS